MSELVGLIAYINPGAGSLLLQFLLVGIAGVLVTFRSSGRWIKDLLIRRKPTRPS